jgi:hypothetical protein
VNPAPFAKRKFWQNFTVAGGKVDEKGVSKGWNICIGLDMIGQVSDLGVRLRADSAT